MPICSREFDRYTLELWNRSDIDHAFGDEGLSLVIRTEGQKNHIRLEGDLFGDEYFDPIETVDRYTHRCYICGNGGDDIERYQYTGFIIHKGCRGEFKENVLEFLDDSSENIVLEKL